MPPHKSMIVNGNPRSHAVCCSLYIHCEKLLSTDSLDSAVQALGAFGICRVLVQQPFQLMLQLLHNIGVAFLLLLFCKVWGNIDVLSTYCVSKAISKSNTHATSPSNPHTKYANGSTCRHCSSWTVMKLSVLPTCTNTGSLQYATAPGTCGHCHGH